MTDKLESKLATLPGSPGVYIMKDAGGNIIYIGKAVSLKNRVRQYFHDGVKDIKVRSMVGHIADFDYIIVSSEKEALLLESNLVKEHRPYYNILLKDDKRFPYLRIDTREEFPRVEVVRKVADDGARYFGPYLSAGGPREVIDVLTRSFPLRLCKKDIARARERGERPCLNHQIGRCAAPCAGLISAEEYAGYIEGVIMFLSGKYDALRRELTEKMADCAERLEYEKCARLRDTIAAIDMMMQRQTAERPRSDDADVVSVACEQGDAVMQVMEVRGGKLLGQRRVALTYRDDEERDILVSAMLSYYTDAPHIPAHIYADPLPADIEALTELLAEKRGAKVEIKLPQRGDYRKLADMARNNATEAIAKNLVTRRREYERTEGACRRLADALGTINEIHRMECYDISNTQGTDSVGSMSVFIDGVSAPKEYRKFKIKTVEGADDFASLHEVLTRRFMRALTGDGKFSELPDLVVIDGGKGQLASAVAAMESLGLHELPLISLAKREEEVYLPGQSEPLILGRDSEELKLLQRLRDEAHRFAITYHRGIRQKRTVITELEGISGVGPTRRRAILAAFSSLDELKNADVEQLCAIDGMNKTAAQAVYAHFHTGA